MSKAHIVTKPAFPGLDLIASDNRVLKEGTPVKTFAETLIKELDAKGYDKPASWRFAKAAKSWCKRGEHDWNVWTEVVRLTAPTE